MKEFDFEKVVNSQMTTRDPFDFSTPARLNTNDVLNPNNSLSEREIIMKLQPFIQYAGEDGRVIGNRITEYLEKI